jgi:predicted dehydrogenase
MPEIGSEPITMINEINGEAQARIAVVGTGWWATEFHIPSLIDHPTAELVAVVDVDPVRLEAVTTTFGIAGYPSLQALLAAGVGIDGVVVATNSAGHFPVAREALGAGLHVMIEKPMVFKADEAWQLVDIARERSLNLQIGYTFHFTNAAQRLHEVIHAGGIGDILSVSGLFASMVEAYYRGDPEAYRSVFDFRLFGPQPHTYSDRATSGGGQAQTQVTHAAGMILWATGLRARAVSAFMESADLAVDLVDAIAVQFESGAVGTLSSTGNLRPGDPQQQEFRYYGTKGFALHDLVAGTLEIRYADGGVERINGDLVGDPYPAREPARAFADLILGLGRNLAPGEAGARTVELIEAAYESADTGQLVTVRRDDASNSQSELST